jgi:hypothetical protein
VCSSDLGLAAWTQSGKHAFGMAMQAMFADAKLTPWANLEPFVRETLVRHGFSETDWKQLRAVPLYEPRDGAAFLRPNEIRSAVGPELAEKYIIMLLRETRFAVPEATVRSRSIMTAGSKPGSFIGELARSGAQFKSFGVAVLMLHMGQVARDLTAGRRARAASYASAMLITGTALGAVAMMLKDIAAGRDPRTITGEDTYLDPWFWGAAILQSGGLGIYGDFLFSQLNRNGGSLPATVAGPLVDRLDNIRNLTFGNVQQVLQGKPTHFGREGVRFLRQNTPLATMWYTRLAYERVLLDQVQKMVDPEAPQAFARAINSRRREYRQEFFWQPGDSAPQRSPNFGAVLGIR